jgi:REP element-mobilizing transposase RayT
MNKDGFEMSHSCVEIYLHVIFTTKNRINIIPQEMEDRLYGYFGGVAKNHKTPILLVNGMPNHVHLLLKLHPSVALSTLIKELKAYSSGWMKDQGVKDFNWQEGYGAFSCSVTHLDPLIKYIQNQKEHHKTRSLEEEIAVLNKAWGVQWMADSNDNKSS